MPAWQRWPVAVARRAYAVGRELMEGQLTMRAASLVYSTLLALVPLLAVSFSLLKAFGVHNELEPFLLQLLTPLGPAAAEISNRLIGFVGNLKVGVLGALSTGLLLVTVFLLMQKIEAAFNYTWHVREVRRPTKRFSDYFSVIIIVPFLAFAALGAMASVTSTTVMQALMEVEPLAAIIELATKLVPYLLIVIAFTFLYIFLPNTKVRLGPALVGAAIAGLLWQMSGWAFGAFVVNSGKYTAIYSAFASLILFIIWVFLSWLILLVGASIAFYQQHPEHLVAHPRHVALSNRLKEHLALCIMYLVGRAHYQDGEALRMEALAPQLRAPAEGLVGVLEALENAGLLRRTQDGAYLPGRPLETTQVRAVLDAVRIAGETPGIAYNRLPEGSPVAGVEERLEQARRHALDGYTVKEMALDRPPTDRLPQPWLWPQEERGTQA